jgi:hypothetical protein
MTPTTDTFLTSKIVDVAERLNSDETLSTAGWTFHHLSAGGNVQVLIARNERLGKTDDEQDIIIGDGSGNMEWADAFAAETGPIGTTTDQRSTMYSPGLLGWGRNSELLAAAIKYTFDSWKF